MNNSNNTVLIEIPVDTVWQLMSLRRRPDEALGHVVTRLSCDPPPRSSGKRIQDRSDRNRRSRYELHMFGDRMQANTLADCLELTLNALYELDADIIERLAKAGGRTRRIVAKAPEQIYPGRRDLARKFTRRLRSGWWMGTNYSQADIRRILNIICSATSLGYGTDIELVDLATQPKDFAGRDRRGSGLGYL